VDLDAVADELYGLTPSEFTATRQARAAEARQSGARELAAAIKKLRRPTTSAWLANRLVRDRYEELVELLELGEATRHAHAKLDADDLRRLSRQRRQVIGALTQDARRLARALGQPVGETVGRELEATLEAAFADRNACEAVRSGRLTTALSYSGLGPTEGPPPPEPSPAPVVEKPAKGASKPEPDEVDRQRRKRSETAALEAVRDAQAAADRARSEAEQQQHRLADARDLLQLREREVSDLEQQLQDRRDARDRASDEIGQAEEAQVEAERRVRMAADELGRAEAELEELRS
jgi:hypothetical protein